MTDSTRLEKGKEVMGRLFGRTPDDAAISSEFLQVTVANLFGDICSRPCLAFEERSMITITALTVLGRENEFKTHLYAAKNLGIPREKIEEMLLHLAHYGGWPTGVARLRKVEEVYAPRKPAAAEKG